MDDEYVVEEFSDEEYDTSSSEDEIQTFIKKECGIEEIKDDFESEVERVMSDHLQKLESSKGENEAEDNSNPSSSSRKISDKEREINDQLFYDPDMDDDDEKWVNSKRRSYIFPADRKAAPSASMKPLPNSDAVLNCPACLSLLCLDCQRHDVYKSQYRAMFVSNCTVVSDEVLKYADKKKKAKKHAKTPQEEVYNPVRCSVCNTEVAVYDSEEIYHFFNVLASY